MDERVDSVLISIVCLCYESLWQYAIVLSLFLFVYFLHTFRYSTLHSAPYFPKVKKLLKMFHMKFAHTMHTTSIQAKMLRQCYGIEKL